MLYFFTKNKYIKGGITIVFKDFDRTWYEADFDYYGGYRNGSRILYSSDGLIFVTYDHYETFYELI